MKKLGIIISAIIIIAAALSACGESKPGSSATADEAETFVSVNNEETQEVSTPYATLKVPAAFKDNVTHKVTKESPYTLNFSAKDGTNLFDLVFNGKGDTLLGTIEGDKENTVLYANLAKLDEKSENYAQYSEFQEGLGTITGNLKKDYAFTPNVVVEKEDETTYDIPTDVVTLKYPARWKDKIKVKSDSKTASFTSGNVKLFDICFFESNSGFRIGAYGETPVYLVTYEFDKKTKESKNYQELAQMQDDVNVIIENLKADTRFSK